MDTATIIFQIAFWATIGISAALTILRIGQNIIAVYSEAYHKSQMAEAEAQAAEWFARNLSDEDL